MSTCRDNPAIGKIGCGATYSGELQHSIARVPWSKFPDGRAHLTASLSVIDKCWTKGTNGQMADPATLGFEQDSRGRWRQPMSEERRRQLAQISAERSRAVHQSASTASRLLLVALVVLTGLAFTARAQAGEHPAVSVVVNAPATDTSVTDTQRALDRLHVMGYRWTTTAGADRAIRHWQRVNGLEVDGIPGPITLASLGLPAAVVAGKKAVAPAVGSGDPSPPVPAADTETVIREVWPDDIEDWAVRIATRESNLQPTARNSCCWGLFQIHWRAHRSWLADYGVTSPEQLLDARTNAIVALALYQATGPGPWSL